MLVYCPKCNKNPPKNFKTKGKGGGWRVVDDPIEFQKKNHSGYRVKDDLMGLLVELLIHHLGGNDHYPEER